MKNPQNNKSFLSLILTNLITIVIAVWQNWSLNEILWVYWLQNIVIGIFQFLKIKDLKNFSTENFRINRHPVEANEITKNKVAYFFLFHYGFFNFVYFVILLIQGPPNFLNLAPLALVFFANHYYSYVQNREIDKFQQKNIGQMMSFPYLRIIPMHLTIILGQTLFKDSSILLFMLLKTYADVFMHRIEHAGFKLTQSQTPIPMPKI